jgi:alginate O-acetyltransferase complex protein AlgI
MIPAGGAFLPYAFLRPVERIFCPRRFADRERIVIFSGFAFLVRFLPCFLLIYLLTPARFRGAILFLGSLAFYAIGEPAGILLLLGELLVNHALYTLGRHLGKRWPGILAALLDIAVLSGFKYLPFYGDSLFTLLGMDPETVRLTMPAGISFFTFRELSFLSDEHPTRKKKRRVDFPEFATYVTFFPHMISGPVTKYSEMEADLLKNAFSKEKAEEGAKLLVIGLSYKLLLGDPLGTVWNSVQTAGTAGLGAGVAWLGAIAYTLQIYFDFFGYSLMAIGLGKLLGFSLPENFREPYSATSFSDFWRRWHITLGRWFKDYVYIPLGGSRKGWFVTIRNLLIVWALTGIWHGATLNFLIWGGVFFLLLTLERFVYGKLLKRVPLLGHIYVLLLLPATWVIFALSDLPTLLGYLMAMVGQTSGEILTGTDVLLRMLHTYWPVLTAGLIFATPLPRKLWEKWGKKLWVSMVLLVLLLVCCREMAIGSDNPFLYFRF